MFLEPNLRSQRAGWIEVICGCMFSGKTEELIRRLRRAQIAELPVQVFKPGVDNRYADDRIVSHDTSALDALPVAASADMLRLTSPDTRVVGIDEAQFFDPELPVACEQLALRGVRVVIAGLDMDYLGIPFGPIPQLLAIAEYVTKVHAICVHCGALATHSYRLAEGDEVVLLGEKEHYEPRCRTCYAMGNILRLK